MADRGEEPPPKSQNGELTPGKSSIETDLGDVGEAAKSPSHHEVHEIDNDFAQEDEEEGPGIDAKLAETINKRWST